jgi:alkylation response protein AidB-like acyl-CoA dehydrogenase
MLRLLTPVAKLYTGKQAVRVASEALECFGGAGYVEDTGLPRLLRDAQVLSIWEGTTNVLSLDVLRAIEKEGAFAPFVADTERRLKSIADARLAPSALRALEALPRLAAHLQAPDPAAVVAGGRGFAYSLARVYAAGLLLEQAQWELAAGEPGGQASAAAATRWCAQDLVPIGDTQASHRADSRALALGL